jgi:hypothetical protein
MEFQAITIQLVPFKPRKYYSTNLESLAGADLRDNLFQLAALLDWCCKVLMRTAT